MIGNHWVKNSLEEVDSFDKHWYISKISTEGFVCDQLYVLGVTRVLQLVGTQPTFIDRCNIKYDVNSFVKGHCKCNLHLSFLTLVFLSFFLSFFFFFLLALRQAVVKLHLKFPFIIASYKSKMSTLKTMYFLKD